MREKEDKLVITFHTTTEAMAVEQACKRDGIPGRIIPVPREISAGCGLSFSMPKEWDGKMSDYLLKQGLSYEAAGIYRI